MNDSQLALTIDFGTQSVKVAVFDQTGSVIAFEKEDYDPPYVSPLPNYAEQRPDYYYECLCRAARRLSANHGDLLKKATVATIDCFRDSCVLLDENMQPLRPMIIWLDQRLATCKKKLPLFDRFLFALVGMTETVKLNRARSYANWIQEHEPEIWAKTKKYVNASAYFTYLITGHLADSPSSTVGHYPIDFKRHRWYKNPERHLKGQIFGVKKSQLADLVMEGEELGRVSAKCAAETGLPEGLRFIASGSDKSCETLGLGVIDSSLAALSLGTACSIETTIDHYMESERFLPGYPSCIPGFYNLDVQIYRGFWMVSWFRKEFAYKASPRDLDKMLDSVPPGADGLVLQPYWGPGLARPLAKGTVIGWSDSSTSAHFYRAIIEGLCYALRESFESFERKVGHRIPTIRVSGGGANSPAICQIAANIFNRKIERVQTTETSSLGAAIAAYLAVGTFKSPEEAIAKMVHPADCFAPDERVAKKYDTLYHSVYLQLFPSLRKAYRNIKAFNRAEDAERLAELEAEKKKAN